MKRQFERILDPFDMHVIWDNGSGVPVMRGGRMLAFAGRAEAEHAVDALNSGSAAQPTARAERDPR